MKPNAKQTQVPGEPVSENLAGDPGDSKESKSDETVVVPKDQLAALLAQVEALSAKVQTLESTPVAAKRANPDVVLPDQGSIDISTLKTPVLTKDGWLVPEGYGAPKQVKA